MPHLTRLAYARNPSADLFNRESVYPEAPGFKAHGASQQAAAHMAASAPVLRALVLEEIRAAPTPLTADQIASRLGKSILAIRPRVSELRRLGEIVPAEERRKNSSGLTATTWKIASAVSSTQGSGSNG